MFPPFRRFAGGVLTLLVLGTVAVPAEDPRGAKIFIEKCALCHQLNGLGVPPVYPPLDGSEWLAGKREDVIKALCEGLSGKIEVAAQHYDNLMPAQILDDAQVVDVLTYVA